MTVHNAERRPSNAPPTTFDKEEYSKLFPLKVGKSVSFKRKWRDKTYQTDLSVLKTETIQTPSGTYDTFVVQRDERQVGGNWKGRAIFWYAPKVRWNVKYKSSDNYGKGQARHVVKIVFP